MIIEREKLALAPFHRLGTFGNGCGTIPKPSWTAMILSRIKLESLLKVLLGLNVGLA
jgi:hypothetical protein